MHLVMVRAGLCSPTGEPTGGGGYRSRVRLVAFVLASLLLTSMGLTPQASAGEKHERVKAYVTNVVDNSVSVIDTRTNTVVDTIRTGIGHAPEGVGIVHSQGSI